MNPWEDKVRFIMKKGFCVLFFILCLFSLYAEKSRNRESDSISETSFIGDSIFSLNTSYTLTGLANNGWGFGISYEHLLFDFCSLRESFSHMTIWPDDYDVVVTTVEIALDAYIFPFCKKLNWLYFGVGVSSDFLNYSNYGKNKDGDVVIKLFPQIGWKQNIKDYVFIDSFYGYKISISDNELPDFSKDLVKQKSEFGISFKINIKNFFKLFFNKS